MASELRRKLRETVTSRPVKFWSKSDLMAPSYGKKTEQKVSIYLSIYLLTPCLVALIIYLTDLSFKVLFLFEIVFDSFIFDVFFFTCYQF